MPFARKEKLTQEERAQQTREKLFHAALETIAEFGYHGTNTKMISERAGVSRGAQTHHFPAKDDLVTESFRYILNEWEERCARYMASESSSPSGYLEFLWSDVVNDPYYISTIEILLAARENLDLQGRLSELNKQFGQVRTGIWRSLFAEGLGDKSDALLRMTVYLYRGMKMQDLLDTETSKINSQILDLWKSYVLGEVRASGNGK